jgi:hypothetical protein
MRIRTRTGLLCLLASGAGLGCDSFEEPAEPGAGGPQLVIPVDDRPIHASSTAPLPVSGGTLSVVAAGAYALIADPERDRLAVVDLSTLAVRHTIALEPGDMPGRSVESADGIVHVALRGAGSVVAIDPASGAVRERRAACNLPRGLAYDTLQDRIHVACADGKLVSLAASGGEALRTLQLDADLRDVVVRDGEIWVSRFKSAEILRVGADGKVVSRLGSALAGSTISVPLPDGDVFSSPVEKHVTLKAGVAWRTVGSSGGALMVHQRAVTDELEVTGPSPSGSSYGGGAGNFGCGGIVQNVITSFLPSGVAISAPFSGPPMAVDVAVSPNQLTVAVAHAGPSDPSAPRPSVVFPEDEGLTDARTGSSFGPPVSSLSVISLSALGSGCQFSQGPSVVEPVVAVAFAPDGRLLAQTREPAQLLVIASSLAGTPVAIALGGEDRSHTGHDLFHRDSGGGIACGSCHPEAGEDGHLWSFTDVGVRRTQALHVGLRGTAPFHWNGDLEGINALMSEVFVGRMGGVRQSMVRVSALTDWIFSVEPPPALRDPADEAAVRGHELFESAAVGCASCHSGEKLTNNQTVAISSERQALQVPSLVAVGHRPPFMHDGCAATLQARFDPACGGDQHGNTAELSPAQIDDLVAYLESL